MRLVCATQASSRPVRASTAATAWRRTRPRTSSVLRRYMEALDVRCEAVHAREARPRARSGAPWCNGDEAGLSASSKRAWTPYSGQPDGADAARPRPRRRQQARVFWPNVWRTKAGGVLDAAQDSRSFFRRSVPLRRLCALHALAAPPARRRARRAQHLPRLQPHRAAPACGGTRCPSPCSGDPDQHARRDARPRYRRP